MATTIASRSKAATTTLGIVLSVLGPSFSASAATLDGVVETSAGQPVNGAMVTVFSANRMRKQTVRWTSRSHRLNRTSPVPTH